jgi:hypothetical protein
MRLKCGFIGVSKERLEFLLLRSDGYLDDTMPLAVLYSLKNNKNNQLSGRRIRKGLVERVDL